MLLTQNENLASEATALEEVTSPLSEVQINWERFSCNSGDLRLDASPTTEVAVVNISAAINTLVNADLVTHICTKV